MKRGQHPNSRKNLKPIKKGEVRNPKGKPVGAVDMRTHLINACALMMDQKHPVTKDLINAPVSQALVYQLVGLGLKGDLPAIKEIFDRIDGKVPQKQEHTGAGGGAIETETQIRWITPDTTDET